MPAKSIDNLVYEYNKDFTRVHSNTDSTLIDEDELAEAVNFYWTQKGLRSRLGSVFFMTIQSIHLMETSFTLMFTQDQTWIIFF